MREDGKGCDLRRTQKSVKTRKQIEGMRRCDSLKIGWNELSQLTRSEESSCGEECSKVKKQRIWADASHYLKASCDQHLICQRAIT